jgi:hypothetical protein
VAIVVGALLILNGFVFRGLINVADTLQAWLPTYCFLGKALRAGHIPAWNPFQLGGTPFAADPQSGWLYAPAMVLFTILPCDVAIRMMVAFHPILAGLGLYWFLRSEGMSRPVASTGGLVISLGMSGAELVESFPFAGTLAWMPVLLACASRFMRASRWSSRVLWGLLTALAWGQLAGAHFSVGLLMGTLALIGFLLAKVFSRAGRFRWSVPRGLLLAGALVAALPLVNLAFLLPRLAYTPQTDLGLGYAKLNELGARLVGQQPPPFVLGKANTPPWALLLAASPGAHLGAVALVMSFAGWWSKRYRHLVVAFTALGGIGYLLSLRVVADQVPSSLRSWRPFDLYLHEPDWFSVLVILSLAVLAALGVAAWAEAPGWRRRIWMVAPGLVVWLLLPLVYGAGLLPMSLFFVGVAAGGAILVLATRRAAWLAFLPVVLALELLTNGILTLKPSQFVAGPELISRIPHPTIPASNYTRPGPIASGLVGSDGRYVRLGGYFTIVTGSQRADNGLVLNHSMLYGIQNAGGYNSVELLRYWEFIRVMQRLNFKYNRSLFVKPSQAVTDLLQVDWLIAQDRSGPPEPGASLVARQGRWGLYRRPVAVPRASLLDSWTVVRNADAARSLVAEPSFDPSTTVVLERDPGLGPPASLGRSRPAAYRPLGDQAARIDVTAVSPSALLIRNVYDRNWHATLDGRPVPITPADYVMQAVMVPPGRHIVELSYDEPTIGYGLAGSAVVVALVLAGFVLLRRRESHVPPPPPPAPGTAPDA